MTVLKNLTLAPMLLKKESQQTAEARAMALLERVGLENKMKNLQCKRKCGIVP